MAYCGAMEIRGYYLKIWNFKFVYYWKQPKLDYFFMHQYDQVPPFFSNFFLPRLYGSQVETLYKRSRGIMTVIFLILQFLISKLFFQGGSLFFFQFWRAKLHFLEKRRFRTPPQNLDADIFCFMNFFCLYAHYRAPARAGRALEQASTQNQAITAIVSWLL